MIIEVVSKSQIRFKRTRARRRPIEKVVVSSIHGYVSIYRRSATQPLGLRWGVENTSNEVCPEDKHLIFLDMFCF
jgi:hypothetical protein